MLKKIKRTYREFGLEEVFKRGLKILLYRLLPKGKIYEYKFFKRYRRKIDYVTPILFDEKLIILSNKVYSDNDLVTRCADKYLVRDYVGNKLGTQKLPKLLGVYDKSSDIDWNIFPEKLVLKCNHGCGYNVIIKNKDEISKAVISKQLDSWLKENYGIKTGELHYKKIPPKIIAEEFLETEDGSLPVDYKFMCSNGKVLYCMLVSGREEDPERICVDKNFDDLKLISGTILQDYEKLKPHSYDEMWKIAEKLSEDFPIVRVDLYDIKGRPIFGELTFTPMGGINSYFNIDAQKKIGEQIQL